MDGTLEANPKRGPYIREINAIHPTFAKELGLWARPIASPWNAFSHLEQKDVDFLGWKLRWRIYTIEEILSTIRHVELVGKKEFAAAALVPEHETHIVHVGSVSSDVSPSSSPLNVYPLRKPQISGLIVEEALTKVSAEYLDFADVFSPGLVSKLMIIVSNWSMPTGSSDHPSHPQVLPFFPILFDRKSDKSLWLCVWDFNNLTIKNRYRCLRLRRYPPSQSVKSDRRRKKR